MPLDEGIGCLGTLLRAAVEIVLEFMGKYFLHFCGHVGACTVCVVTLGWWKPDPESWGSIGLGLMEVIGLIGTVMHWLL